MEKLSKVDKVKQKRYFTSIDIQEETEMTEKQPENESTIIAPMTVNKQVQPLITFET